MDKLNVKGNWNELSGKVKQIFVELTDDNVLFKEGNEDELLGSPQPKHEEIKEQTHNSIEKF